MTSITIATHAPMTTLATLAANDDIAPIERDAGQIIHELGKHAYSGKDPGKSVWFNWRNPNGTWSQVRCQQREAKQKLEAALAAIRTDERRRVVTVALVAREPELRPEALHSFAAGLEDLTRHFWGATAIPSTKRNGVTLPRVSILDNGPTPERLMQAANDNHPKAHTAVFRGPFHRMFERGQLDEDEAINELLYSAGVRFYQDWYYGGLSGGLGSFDYSKPIVSGGGGAEATQMPRTMREAHHRQAFRQAAALLTAMELQILAAVVLDEKTVSGIARAMTGIGDQNKALPKAKATLAFGLAKLVRNYGLGVAQAA